MRLSTGIQGDYYTGEITCLMCGLFGRSWILFFFLEYEIPRPHHCLEYSATTHRIPLHHPASPCDMFSSTAPLNKQAAKGLSTRSLQHHGFVVSAKSSPSMMRVFCVRTTIDNCGTLQDACFIITSGTLQQALVGERKPRAGPVYTKENCT